MRAVGARSRGFVLVPVVLVLAVVGAIAWALQRGSPANAAAAGRSGAMERARAIAEAGLNHAVWRLARWPGCSDYADTPTTSFGGGTYSVKVAQSSGSPVTLIAKGQLPDGTTATLTRRVAKTTTAALTYTLQPGATGQDTYLEQLLPSRNFGAADELWLDYGDEHTLLRFDLSPLPAGSRVQSAQLMLYQLTAGSGSGADAIRLHRPLRAWTAGTGTGAGGSSPNGASWSAWDGINPWSTPGTGPGNDYDPVPAATQPFATGTGWKSWDVTALVQGWMGGLYPNDGVALIPTTGIANIKYAASESTSATSRPKLVVTYTPPCGATSPPRDGEAGLVAHWKLDETSGATAQDAAGSNSGTLVGGAWTTAVRSGGLALNGSGQYVTVADAATLSLTDALTLSAWVRSDSVSGTRAILTKGTAVDVVNYALSTNGSELELSFYDAGWRRFTTSGLNLQPGMWVHVAATFGAATNAVTLYANGVQVLSATTSRRLRGNSGGLTLGRSPAGEYWSGALDDVRVYDRVLTATEIASAMNARALAAAADGYIEGGGNADRNFGSATNVQLSASGPTRRGLARFDLAGITPGTVVQRATLRYFVDTVGGRTGLPMSLSLHAVTESWVEGTQSDAPSTAGATWDHRQVTPTQAWSSAGGSYVPGAAATATLPAGFADKQYVDFDATALVQEWVDGVRANLGAILIAPGPETFVLFSRESSKTPPQLLISW